MTPYFVYILFSDKLDKYYVGFTIDAQNRLAQHNNGISNFTSKGIPWRLIHVFEVDSIENAKVLEKAINTACTKHLVQYVDGGIIPSKIYPTLLALFVNQNGIKKEGLKGIFKIKIYYSLGRSYPAKRGTATPTEASYK